MPENPSFSYDKIARPLLYYLHTKNTLRTVQQASDLGLPWRDGALKRLRKAGGRETATEIALE